MNKTTHPYFVENGESRRDTAILLVGTADEFGIDQRDVRAVRGGFRISQAMADVLYDEREQTEDEQAEGTEPEDEQPEEPKAPAKRSRSKKTSGDRAAKNTATEQE